MNQQTIFGPAPRDLEPDEVKILMDFAALMTDPRATKRDIEEAIISSWNRIMDISSDPDRGLDILAGLADLALAAAKIKQENQSLKQGVWE